MIRVQPDEGVTIRFGSKVPGAGMQVRDVTMDFGYGHAFTEASPEAYERLILDVLLGDPPLFPRHEEVELSWKILDPIEEFWATQGQPRAVPPRDRGGRHPPTSCSPATAAPGGVRDRRSAQHHDEQDLEDPRQDSRRRRRRRARPRADAHHLDAASATRKRPSRPPTTPRASTRCASSWSRPILRSAKSDARLDAQIRVGGDAGASEVIVVRAYGEAAHDQESLVTGLLLPDAPVVAWWPGSAPSAVSESRIGRIAQRRITDAASGADPAAALCARSASTYRPGDTDFAWTRLTLLARAARRRARPAAVRVRHGRRRSRRGRLAVDRAARRVAATAASSASRLSRSRASRTVRAASKEFDSTAPRARSSSSARWRTSRRSCSPASPTHDISLPRRSLRDCLAEELRRLDPDDLFGDVITEGVSKLGKHRRLLLDDSRMSQRSSGHCALREERTR